MIRVALFDPATAELQFGGRELIESWRGSDSQVIWLDIISEAGVDDDSVLVEFGIHRLAIQDALRPRHPPKIERFGDVLFILLRGLDAATNSIDFAAIQLALFLGDRFLVTRHTKRSVSADWLYEEIKRQPEPMAEGPGGLAVRLSNNLARRYLEILLELEPRLDDIEEEMFKRPSDALLLELTRYKSRLRRLTRIAKYHEQVALKMRTGNEAYFAESLSHDIVDLYEQIERTLSLANLYYQIASDLTDGYIGMTSHRLNRVMQILTVITVVFVPLTFLAGIYGMNFENMPELGTRYGYFLVIGIMLIAAIAQLTYFRRKRWI